MWNSFREMVADWLQSIVWLVRGYRPNEENNLFDKLDPKLEAGLRRCLFPGHNEQAVFRLWNAINDERKMGRVLQPGKRSEESPEVRRRKKENRRRTILLTSFLKSYHFQAVADIFTEIETNAYYYLKYPGQSSEASKRSNLEVTAFYSGVIDVIDSFRTELVLAASASEERRKKEKENKQKKQPKRNGLLWNVF